jgi:hypothetical protein
MLYDRPVSELMIDAARDLIAPFRPAGLVTWFAAK